VLGGPAIRATVDLSSSTLNGFCGTGEPTSLRSGTNSSTFSCRRLAARCWANPSAILC